MAGVGMTPPKVLVMPYPWSSVMISSTLGAPLGGTTVGGQPGLESAALRLALPAKGGGGFGIYLPSIVVVALGEPGVPVVCWAPAGVSEKIIRVTAETDNASAVVFMILCSCCLEPQAPRRQVVSFRREDDSEARCVQAMPLIRDG